MPDFTPGLKPQTQLLPQFLSEVDWMTQREQCERTHNGFVVFFFFFFPSPFADTLCLVVYTLLWQIWLGFPAGAPGRSENGELSRAAGQPLDGLAGGVPSQPGRYTGGRDRDSAGTRGPGGYRASGYGESRHFQFSAAPTKTAAGSIHTIVVYCNPLM